MVRRRRSRWLQRLLIAAQAVAQHRGRPLHGTQPSTLTPAPYVVGGGLDQLSGLRFLAAEDGQGQSAVRRDADPGRPGYRLGLRHQRGGAESEMELAFAASPATGWRAGWP